MGYESRLYIIKKSDLGVSLKDDKKKFAEIVAMFNLCKVDINFSKYPATGHFIFAEGGDEETHEDRYGDPLRELSLSDAIKEIENAMADDDYRRFKPCLALLREFNDTNKTQWGNKLAVLHYGY